MDRYAFIVSANRPFFPAINALFNSLDYIGFTGSVIFIRFPDFPEDYLTEVSKKLSFRLSILNFDSSIPVRTEKMDYLKRYRYKIAYAINDGYQFDALCFLDADMFFVRPVDLFFRIADTGIMVGAAKSGKTRYGGNPSYFVNGKDTVDPPVWNEKDICCCPIFFNDKFRQIFKDVWDGYMADDPFKASDLFALNAMILKNSADKNLITMPCQSFVGTNETMLKPYTRIIEKEGNLISENGDLVYSIHGKWFSEGWHNGQILHMERLINVYLGNTDYWRSKYRRSMNDIMKWFLKMQFYKIKLSDYERYTKPEHLKFIYSCNETVR